MSLLFLPYRYDLFLTSYIYLMKSFNLLSLSYKSCIIILRSFS